MWIIRARIHIALIALLLAACTPQGDPERNRFEDAATCEELLADFEAVLVSDDPAERKEVGDEYRARFRELDCEL